ncbi:MAG: LysR substrate-binding domain-containing protein [Methyloligellaceae bacterium]
MENAIRKLKNTINFNRLRCFHAVATEGSFTMAAKALKVSQPSITTHIKALEEDYGVELFARHGHHVELTDLGRTLLALSQNVFTLERDAVELLMQANELCIGHLKIGAIGPSQVTEMILAFGKKFPGIELSVSLGNSEEVLKRVFDFRDDVGIVPQMQADSRLHSLPYSRNRIVLLVRKDHPWADRDKIGLEEITDHRLVLREVGSATRRIFEETLAKSNIEIRRVLAIGSREAVREAVAAGLGIGIALDDESLSDERLKPLRIADADLFLHPHVVCLQDRKDAPVISAFFSLVAEITAND